MALSVAELTQTITETMATLQTTLDAELTQVAEALANASNDPAVQALIDEQTARLLTFKDTFNASIANIIPDPPPVP